MTNVFEGHADWALIWYAYSSLYVGIVHYLLSPSYDYN